MYIFAFSSLGLFEEKKRFLMLHDFYFILFLFNNFYFFDLARHKLSDVPIGVDGGGEPLQRCNFL